VTQVKITRYAAALGFNGTDYAFALHGLDNGQVFSASYYHRVNTDVDASARAIYDTKGTTNGVALEVGAKA
jgi:voltage-dependent anion channel protein 2